MQIDWITFSLLTALALFMIGAFVVYRRRSSRTSTDNAHETHGTGVTGLKAAEGGQVKHGHGNEYYSGSGHEYERERKSENEPLTSPFSRLFPNHKLPTPLYHAPVGSQEALVRNLGSDQTNMMNTTRNGRTVPDKWRWEAA